MSSLYVLKEGKKWGPYSEEELAAHVEAGAFTPSDMVWAEGYEDWMPLSSLITVEAEEAPDVYFDQDGIQVTKECVRLEESEIPLGKVSKAGAQIEKVKRMKPLIGSIIVGVIAICVALVEVPKSTTTHWVIWGGIILALAIWWLRLLFIGLRNPSSLIVIDLIDGNERILQAKPDVAAKFDEAVHRALADFRARIGR